MAITTAEDAVKVLEPLRAEYAWLFDGQLQWSVDDLFETMKKNGLPFSKETILRWLRDKKIPYVSNYGGRVGYLIPKAGLLIFFARRIAGELDTREADGEP